MKNFTKLIISCLIVLTGLMPLHAQGQEFNHDKVILFTVDNVSSSYDEISPYVNLKGDQFYLNLPENIILSDEVRSKVEAIINGTNLQIAEMRRNLAISSTAASINTDSFNNTVTFSINDSVLFAQENANSKYTESSSYFSSGVTSISFHWNYARFSLSRNVVISISAVSTAVARNKMAAVVASLGITGGWASVLTYGTVFIASWLSTNLISLYPNGMFIDFNYFGLAGCGIGYIVGGVFGIAATIAINLLAPLRPNVCGVTVGHQ